MVNATSFSATGTKHDKSVELDEAVFGLEASHELVGQAYSMYLSNGRIASASTLKRGQVAGGGKKPWRQKGTGRARVGSIRVPNWRGGGVVFGPTGNENYSVGMPVKMKRAAIRQALSLRAGAGDIIIIEAFDGGEGKTRPTAELLARLKLSGRILFALEAKTDMTERATRNIAGLKMVSATYLNVYDIMNADKIVLTQAALDAVKNWLGEKK